MKNKIEVLHLIETLRLGGGEKNLFNLISHMDPAAVSHHVAYGWGGEFEKIVFLRIVVAGSSPSASVWQ